MVFQWGDEERGHTIVTRENLECLCSVSGANVHADRGRDAADFHTMRVTVCLPLHSSFYRLCIGKKKQNRKEITVWPSFVSTIPARTITIQTNHMSDLHITLNINTLHDDNDV